MASFSGPASKRLALGTLFLAGATLIAQASELWFASYLADSGRPERIQRAAKTLPGDADFWDRLGRSYFLSFANPNVTLAIANYRKAVTVDPHSEHYWMDLANAYEAEGDSSKAQDAFEHARAVYPSSAEVAWYYGNFLLRENNQGGYAEVQRAIRGNPSLLPLALSRTWRSSGNIDELLNSVIPANPQSYLGALDSFASIQDPQPGMAVWQRLKALAEPFPLRGTFTFLEELIREDDSRDASRIWNDAVTVTNSRTLQAGAANLVSDGEFQTAFPNGGLGWRWDPAPSTAINFDEGPPGVSGRSVRLNFGGGANLRLEQPAQFIAVEPSTTYHFRALIRTEGISTDSGVRFEVADPHHADVPALTTANFVGSHPWTKVEGNFAGGAQTHFLVIRFYREPSRSFESRLSGTAWMADVSLAETAPPADRPKE